MDIHQNGCRVSLFPLVFTLHQAFAAPRDSWVFVTLFPQGVELDDIFVNEVVENCFRLAIMQVRNRLLRFVFMKDIDTKRYFQHLFDLYLYPAAFYHNLCELITRLLLVCNRCCSIAMTTMADLAGRWCE